MANPRRTNSTKRNAVRQQVLHEEDICWICNQPVDKTLTTALGQHGPRCTNAGCAGCIPHPMRAEVDEVIPVSKGGSPYDRDNCRLSHRICNQRRGNGDTKAAQREPTEPFPHSGAFADLFGPLGGTP